ncbi:hypothetical protein CR513_41603, partial [Mucuna pruriens]
MLAKVCGICTFVEHPTDMCPTLQETESDEPENIGAIVAIENVASRQFPISGGSNEQHAFLAEYDHHHLRPQDTNRISVGSSSLPSQTIPNPRRNDSAVTLRSGKELPQPASSAEVKSEPFVDSKPFVDSEPFVDSQSQQDKTVPVSFPTRTISVRKPESDEELLKMFRKVEINIPLLNAIKQIPKYAKFLKELCTHKRKKMKGGREIGGVVSMLTKNENFTKGAHTLPKKCRDPRIFSVPCTIGDCTFANAMLDLGASISVMPTSIYKALNFGDLEPTRMTIQLANRSIVQPLGILEDVIVQVNELIFPADFYVIDMEDETSKKEATLILGRPFLMIARTKIDMHVRTLSIEFNDTLVQFNIFEAMKHLTEDHSLFGIDVIEELVEEYFQLNGYSEDIEDFAGSTNLISCIGLITKEADYMELLLPITSVRSKKINLPGINPFICMHRILMEEEIKPIRKQQRRRNPTILDVVKKEVTKLLAVRIIYPISDSQWVSPMQVLPKKSGMIVTKNQQDELVPTRIQNRWQVCIDYRRLNQATRKDHFLLPFIDQVLEKLSGKSHYFFLDGFLGYMQIHIALEDQYKTTFTCPFGTFAYTCMPFGLCNAPSTFQRCMISIFSDLL